MDNFDHILLFKTNIQTEQDKLALRLLLDLDDRIQQWSIDMDDEDNVLRIVTPALKHQHIIDLMTIHGYSCCELT